MTITVPDDLLQALQLSEEELLLELAIVLYVRRKLSLGKASQLARIDRFALQHALAERKIPMNYSEEDLQKDLKTLDQLFGK